MVLPFSCVADYTVLANPNRRARATTHDDFKLHIARGSDRHVLQQQRYSTAHVASRIWAHPVIVFI